VTFPYMPTMHHHSPSFLSLLLKTNLKGFIVLLLYKYIKYIHNIHLPLPLYSPPPAPGSYPLIGPVLCPVLHLLTVCSLFKEVFTMVKIFITLPYLCLPTPYYSTAFTMFVLLSSYTYAMYVNIGDYHSLFLSPSY
jgi:membrane-associated HD superfamily phosphohydrolase